MATTTPNSLCFSLLSVVAENSEPLPSKWASASGFQAVFTEALHSKWSYSVTIIFQFIQQTELNRFSKLLISSFVFPTELLI
jgi:hypothetical protein